MTATLPMYDAVPQSWQELQVLVAQLFTEMGCDAEIEKRIRTVRGSSDVDVYVVDGISSPTLRYVCECKYWKKRIPKHVVHAVRTVVQDCGADVGFVISSEGFQSGAVAAAAQSNVRLLSWTELLEMMEPRWTAYRHGQVGLLAKELNGYMHGEFVEQLELKSIDPSRRPYYVMQWKEHFSESLWFMGAWMANRDKVIDGRPLRSLKSRGGDISWINFKSKHDFFEYITNNITKCISKGHSLLRYWTSASLAAVEQHRGRRLSMEEAAAALELPQDLFVELAEDAFGVGRDPRREEYSLADLMRLASMLPDDWLPKAEE